MTNMAIMPQLNDTMSNYEDADLLKNFLLQNFDFNSLKKSGLFNKDIKKTDYKKQADRICEFFGFESIYQFGFETISAHITYVDGYRPKNEPFVKEFKAWHEN